MVETQRKPSLADMARRTIKELNQDPLLFALAIFIIAACAQIADAGASANYNVDQSFPGITGIERDLKVQTVLQTTERPRSEAALATTAAALLVGIGVGYRQLKIRPTK